MRLAGAPWFGGLLNAVYNSRMTSNAVALVTGGGRGIGRAICRKFAADGTQVVAAARSVEQLEETRRLIQSAGGRCHVHVTDLCQPDDIIELMEDAAQRFGRVDVLVNCAGVAPAKPIEELDAAIFEAILSVNVTAVYHACRAVWPIMRRQGGGTIINLSSIASMDPFPGFAAYGAAKAWVNTWTRGLAEEGRSDNIRVFAVAPGAVDTKMLRDAFPEFPAEQMLQPDDVAGLVHALAQPACRHATGQTVFVRK